MPEHRRVISHCRAKKKRTKQSFKNDCDINVLMARHRRGIPLSPDQLNQRQAIFADVSSIGDYQTIRHKIASAEAKFQTVPAAIRARFNNNPAQFLAFFNNPDNRDECIELGLIQRPPQKEKPIEKTPSDATQATQTND